MGALLCAGLSVTAQVEWPWCWPVWMAPEQGGWRRRRQRPQSEEVLVFHWNMGSIEICWDHRRENSQAIGVSWSQIIRGLSARLREAGSYGKFLSRVWWPQKFKLTDGQRPRTDFVGKVSSHCSDLSFQTYSYLSTALSQHLAFFFLFILSSQQTLCGFLGGDQLQKNWVFLNLGSPERRAWDIESGVSSLIVGWSK